MIEDSIVNFTMNHTKMYHNIVIFVKQDSGRLVKYIQGHMKVAHHGRGIPLNNKSMYLFHENIFLEIAMQEIILIIKLKYRLVAKWYSERLCSKACYVGTKT